VNEEPQYTGIPNSRRAFRLFDFIFRRGLVAAVGGLLVCGVVLPVAIRKASPTYEARGAIIVSPEEEPLLSGQVRDRIPGDFGDYTRTIAARFEAYEVLEEALMKIPKEKWPNFLKPELTDEENVYKLMSRLKVRPMSRTFLIEVKLAASQPDSLAVLTNMVMATLVERVSEEQEESFSRRLDYLGQEKDKLEARLREMRGEVLAVANQAGSAAFLHEAYDAHLNRLNLLQRQSLEADRDLLWATSEVNKTEAFVKSVQAQSIEPLAAIRIADDYGINRMELWTYEKLQELRGGIDGLTVDNEDRQYVEKRMTNMEEYLDNYRVNAQAKMRKRMVEERNYHLEQSEMEVAAASRRAELRAEEMNRRYEEARATANQVSAAIYRASGTSRAITHAEDRVAALTSRIHDTQLLARSPVPVAIEEFARPPKSPASSNLMKLLVVGVAFSFALIGGICLVVDFVDQRVRTPGDLEHCFGGPVSAVVPEGTDKESSLSLRQFAARLALQRENFDARVHLLCGVEAGSGTTTLTDFVRAALVEHGITTTVVNVGDAPADQAGKDIVKAREQFDLVLVDAPAYQVSESCLHLARYADSATVIVPADKSSCGNVASAVNGLLAVRVPGIAVILNFAQPAPGEWLLRSLLPKCLGSLSAVHRLTRKIISI
jgi:uncharacterized protein involved in exopolysaccharide biosynthesis